MLPIISIDVNNKQENLLMHRKWEQQSTFIQPNNYESILFSPKDLTSTSNNSFTFVQEKDYKNGIYFGRINKAMLRQSIGIVLYDSGDLLIADFDSNYVNGPFLYFQCTKYLCYYGILKDEKLDGVCYVMNRNNYYIKQTFHDGIPHSSRLKIDRFKVKNIDHQMNDSNKKQNNYTISTQNCNHAQDTNNGYSSSLQQFCLNPAQFIFKYFTNKQHEKSFQLYTTYQDQQYFGLQQQNKPYGYGIILQDNWPICYGHFSDGNINGFARIQQNKSFILDGIFHNNVFIKGWIINFINNTVSFGTQLRENNKQGYNNHIKDSDNMVFQIQEQFNGLQFSIIQKFRRHHHIRSLNYTNSYLPQFLPNIIQLTKNCSYLTSPQIIQLYRQQHQQKKQNFIGLFISKIQKINWKQRKNTAENNHKQLIQLIKEYHHKRSIYLTNTKMLKDKYPNNKQIKKQNQFQKRSYKKQNNGYLRNVKTGRFKSENKYRLSQYYQ